MGGGGGKVKTTVTDPQASYKQWQTGELQNQYNQIQPATNRLMGYFDDNFGQSDFGTQIPQLLRDVIGSVQGDVSGTGGPFTSLKKNLLGDFDVGAQDSSDRLKEQLIKQGIYSSGGGLDAQSSAGAESARQRALLGSEVDVNMLNFANQLGQQQFQNNQLLGIQNPLTALQAAQGILPQNAPEIASNSMYKPSTWESVAPLLGQLGGAAIGSFAGGPMGAVAGSQIGGNSMSYGQPLAPYSLPNPGTQFLGAQPYKPSYYGTKKR